MKHSSRSPKKIGMDQLRGLLERTTALLDSALCPKIDHEEAKAWIDQRNALVEEAKAFLQEEEING